MKALNIGAALALATGLAGTASAANISINTNAGTTYSTPAVTDFQVTGNEMDGMLVTVRYRVDDGAIQTQTVAWGDIAGNPSNDGGATFSGSGFDLYLSGDTISDNNWELDFSLQGTARLLSIAFDGPSGNTVFDRFGAMVGTPGSNIGNDFDGFSTFFGDITATYSNGVAIGANAPVGDLFANVLIEFGEFDLGFFGKGFGLYEGDFRFTLDTDHAELTPAAVPEPGSMLLLGSGLVGLAARLRRKKA